MTTNIDRAAEVMEQAWCERSRSSKPEGFDERLETVWEELHANLHKITRDEVAMFARALAEAGLLAPDALPPLDFYDDCGVWPINAHPDQYVEMRVTGTGRRLVEMHAPAQMEPLTALRLAAALIEAVTLANKEKK